MQYSIAMTCYNRPEYLERSLDTLFRSDLSRAKKIYLCDDCSTEDKTKELLSSYSNHPKLKIIYNEKRLGCDPNMIKSIKIALEDTDPCVTIDSDCVFNREWLNKIHELKTYVDDNSISWGSMSVFNTIQRHGIVKKLEKDIVLKKSLGGFAALVQKKIIDTIGVSKWDWKYVHYCRENNLNMLSTYNSYVDHIGIKGEHSGNGIPDYAYSFVGI